MNKLSEKSDMTVTETEFCRLTTQASADALLAFIDLHRTVRPSLQRVILEREAAM